MTSRLEGQVGRNSWDKHVICSALVSDSKAVITGPVDHTNK